MRFDIITNLVIHTTITQTTFTTGTHHFRITKAKNSMAVKTSSLFLKIVSAKHVSVTSHQMCSPIESRSFGRSPPSRNNFVSIVNVLTATAMIAFPSRMYANFDDCRYARVR